MLSSDNQIYVDFTKQPGFIGALLDRFAPEILGMKTEKYVSILSIISENDSNSKNRINILFKGSASCGKSSIIRWMYENCWGYFADSNTNKSGFKGSITGYMFKPGLLQKAHNSILYIDEIDKFKPDDLDALLSAMQHGKVTLANAKLQEETDASVRVIATCNNEARLRRELISRFDLVIEVKPLSLEERRELVKKKAMNWDSKTKFDDFFIPSFLEHVYKFKSKLPEDRTEIIELINKELENGALHSKDIRKIESVFRLALSISKLHLKDVSIKEVKEAINLIKQSRY